MVFGDQIIPLPRGTVARAQPRVSAFGLTMVSQPVRCWCGENGKRRKARNLPGASPCGFESHHQHRRSSALETQPTREYTTITCEPSCRRPDGTATAEIPTGFGCRDRKSTRLN